MKSSESRSIASIGRRDFLASAGAVTGGLLMAHEASGEQNPAVMDVHIDVAHGFTAFFIETGLDFDILGRIVKNAADRALLGNHHGGNRGSGHNRCRNTT